MVVKVREIFDVDDTVTIDLIDTYLFFGKKKFGKKIAQRINL